MLPGVKWQRYASRRLRILFPHHGTVPPSILHSILSRQNLPERQTMAKPIPDWERYERLVARIVSDQLSTAYCVTPNAFIEGKISGIKRQIDVLIDSRHDTDNRTRVIIDAKMRKRRIDVKEVEAFLGVMTDVRATHGYLVCPQGYTSTAEKRAQEAISLRLLPLCSFAGRIDPVRLTLPPYPRERRDPVVRPLKPQFLQVLVDLF